MVLKALLKASCLLRPVKRQGIGEGKAASSPITMRGTHLEGLFELRPPAPALSPPPSVTHPLDTTQTPFCLGATEKIPRFGTWRDPRIQNRRERAGEVGPN